MRLPSTSFESSNSANGCDVKDRINSELADFVKSLQSVNGESLAGKNTVHLDGESARTAEAFEAVGVAPSNMYIPNFNKAACNSISVKYPAAKVSNESLHQLICSRTIPASSVICVYADYCCTVFGSKGSDKPKDDISAMFASGILEDVAVIAFTFCTRTCTKKKDRYAYRTDTDFIEHVVTTTAFGFGYVASKVTVLRYGRQMMHMVFVCEKRGLMTVKRIPPYPIGLKDTLMSSLPTAFDNAEFLDHRIEDSVQVKGIWAADGDASWKAFEELPDVASNVKTLVKELGNDIIRLRGNGKRPVEDPPIDRPTKRTRMTRKLAVAETQLVSNTSIVSDPLIYSPEECPRGLDALGRTLRFLEMDKKRTGGKKMWIQGKIVGYTKCSKRYRIDFDSYFDRWCLPTSMYSVADDAAVGSWHLLR